MFDLPDYEWLCSDEGDATWNRCRNSISQLNTATIRHRFPSLTELRIRLLCEQWDFVKSKASKKVSNPERWFWTKQLLEQATDEETALETALDFPADAEVIDGCCGAGVDAIALARRGCQVTAVEISPIALQLARHNFHSNGLKAEFALSDLSEFAMPKSAFLHIDPDRRTEGKRSTHVDQFSPPWTSIAAHVASAAGCSIKLAPATIMEDSMDWGPTGPPHSVRWLSKDRSVRQQRWTWKLPRWPVSSRVVSTQVHEQPWHHEVFELSDWNAPNIDIGEIATERTSLKNWFIADQDPALRAARLTVPFAVRYSIQILGNEFGYFIADRFFPHPMLRWFEVIDVLPFDKKKLRAYSRTLLPRTWEIKSRNVDVDIDSLRRELPTNSQSSVTMTLLITRVQRRHIAIIASVTSNAIENP